MAYKALTDNGLRDPELVFKVLVCWCLRDKYEYCVSCE